MTRETDLYPPVKAFLESQGYEVKSEIHGCDVVAAKDGTIALIVELKLSFTLDLVLQGVERLSRCETVYLAVPKPDTAAKRKAWRGRLRSVKQLLRRIGLGLLLVDKDAPEGRHINVVVEPTPYTPRQSKKKTARLQREFQLRKGDPNMGGTTRTIIMTAYRQDALTCARCLADKAPQSPKDIRTASGVERAAAILQANHYGWFTRVSRGVYTLSEDGRSALDQLEEG